MNKLKCVMIDHITNKQIKTFNSLKEAGEYCRKLNLTNAIAPSNNISYACKNNTKSYGYLWQFL